MQIYHDENVNISLPLIAYSNPNYCYVTLSWTRCTDDLELYAFSNIERINFKESEGQTGKLYDFLKTHGVSTLVIFDNSDEWVRIFVKILPKELAE